MSDFRKDLSMSRVLSILLGLALVRGAAAQGRPLTALSAEEQTRLALSTAPPEVSSRASLYILTPNRGYRQVRTGTNGFSCLVERAFLEALEPVCYDAEGSATTLPARLYREELRAQGLPEDEVRRRIAAAYQDGRLRAPRKPGLVYMLAPEQWSWNPFAKKFWNAPPHFMLYAPFATQEALGGFSGPHMPVVDSPGQPDALIIIMAQDSTHLRSTDSRKPSH